MYSIIQRYLSVKSALLVFAVQRNIPHLYLLYSTDAINPSTPQQEAVFDMPSMYIKIKGDFPNFSLFNNLPSSNSSVLTAPE